MFFEILIVFYNKEDYMHIEQLSCPICQKQYSESNPPRFLTMCGHTFCHKCIRTLITKKKQKCFKIRCPLDQKVMEIQKPNPTLFPKNMILVSLILKKTQTEQKSKEQENEFLSISECQQKSNNSKKEIIHHKSSKNKILLQINEQKCKIHNKSLQIFCMKEMHSICTDCALYGSHRNHEIKNILDLQVNMSQASDNLLSIKSQIEAMQTKLADKQIDTQITDLLENKRELIKKQIAQTFHKLRDQIDEKQKSLEEEVQQKVLIVLERIRRKMKIEQILQMKFSLWTSDILKMGLIKQVTQPDRVTDGLKQFVKSGFFKDKLSQGNQILLRMEGQQNQFLEGVQNQLNGFKLLFDQNAFHNVINNKMSILCEGGEFQNFKTQNQNTFTPIFKSNYEPRLYEKENYGLRSNYLSSYGDQEESLLDFETIFQPNMQPLCLSTVSCNNISKISTKSFLNKNRASNIKSVIKNKQNPASKDGDKLLSNSEKKRAVSRNLSSFISGPKSTSLNKQSVVKNGNSFKKVSLEQKHLSLIKEIRQNKIESVDLTGAELSEDKLTLILEQIGKSQSIKTLKLMRNKLDDDFIEKSFRKCLNVECLNIAQNKLSQESVQKVLSILRDSQGVKLRYLNMGQNRIVERKNRKILQQFKKMNINIIM